MDYLNLAKQRYSVRNFQTRPVEDEKMMKILEAGRAAPTAANRQPQRLIVIRQMAGLEKLKKAAYVYEAPLAIIVCGDVRRAWVRPFDGQSSIQIDTTIVTDQMMMEATDLGLGTIWICLFKPEVIRREFSLPDYLEPVNILGIGYAADEGIANGSDHPFDQRHGHASAEARSPNRHDRTRRPLQETVFFEKL